MKRLALAALVLLAGCREIVDLAPPPRDAGFFPDASAWPDAAPLDAWQEQVDATPPDAAP